MSPPVSQPTAIDVRERAHKGTGDPPARRAILNPLYSGPSTLDSPELLTSSGDDWQR